MCPTSFSPWRIHGFGGSLAAFAPGFRARDLARALPLRRKPRSTWGILETSHIDGSVGAPAGGDVGKVTELSVVLPVRAVF